MGDTCCLIELFSVIKFLLLEEYYNIIYIKMVLNKELKTLMKE